MRVRYPHLLSPFTLGRLELRNRAVMLPMGARYAVDGRPSDRDRAYFRARARGGTGLIITGGTLAAPSTTYADRRLFEPYTDSALPGFRDLVATVHREGAKIIGQIVHLGREIGAGDTDWAVIAPSAVASPASGQRQVPHAMTRDEIRDMVDQQARCAENLLSAGYDGIELHAAHGYLGGQFLSPASNHRDDEYGGSIPNRLRFLVETIAAVRARCGPDTVLGVRLSGDEGLENGLRAADSVAIAAELARSGVDYLSITTGIKGTYVPEIGTPHAPAAGVAAEVRRAVTLPLLVGQRITTPEIAERVLAEGAADLIGIGRALVADPDWFNKAARGEAARIRRCTGCMQECRNAIGGMACMNNPEAGRELTLPRLSRAARLRKVVVVGGGPGGLETAVVAAERGHAVTLFEQAAELGGQARLAARVPRRAELAGVIEPRRHDVARLGVDVRLGARAGAAEILAEAPDAVVLATGAVANRTGVPGGGLEHVRTLPELFEAGRPAGAGSAVVLDDGTGFWEAVGAVELLAEWGLHVDLVTPSQMVGANVPAESMPFLLRRLADRGVGCHRLSRPVSIEAEAVVIEELFGGRRTRLETDLVVTSSGKRAADELAGELRDAVPTLTLIGDCLAPRRIAHAILEGNRAGRAVGVLENRSTE
jgi:2,4-dienoyl-CoA reductase (NADPH2)